MKERDKTRLRKIALQLKKLREQKGFSQRQLALHCDVDVSKINKIEKHKANLMITTLIELADGLGVHPRDLLDIDFEKR